MFQMWEQSVGFSSGYYVYFDGKEHNSVISRLRAHELEEEYQRYQADMDVNRGGMDPDRAYPARGFVGMGWDWTYKSYKMDAMSANQVVLPITDRFVIPYQVEDKPINTICDRAFCKCTELTEIMIPNYIHSIGKEAFLGCTNLYHIKLTDQIASIGAQAFEETAYYEDYNNWTGTALYINNWLIKVNEDVEGEFKVADEVVGIADEAFRGCTQLTRVVLPDTVKHIGNQAFSRCTALSEVVFPSIVSDFGSQVFIESPNLSVLKLPIGLSKIDGFRGNTALTSVVLPEGLTTIGQDAFRDCCNLRDIHLPLSLERIEWSAFQNSGYVNDPRNWSENVLYLDHWILDSTDDFHGSYRIEDGTIGIADEAFTIGRFNGNGYESLTELWMPDSIRFIGVSAFELCRNLGKVNLSRNLTSICRSMFRGNEKLTEITIPYSVKCMDIWVFYECPNLVKIIIENPNMEIVWPAIYKCPKLTVYCYHGSKVEEYMRKNMIPYAELKR